MTQMQLTLTRPDDWHIHLRDQHALKLTVPAVSRYFGRAIVMPNLVPPVNTVERARAYRDRIYKEIPTGSSFEPLMTLYLTDSMSPKEIINGKETGVVTACKLYPAGATTNSDSGVTDIRHIHSVLEAMQKAGMPLLIHGEVTSADIDIYDREAVFIERHLEPLIKNFPELKIVLEHITTADSVQFIEAGSDNLAATITAHHLLYERNHMLVGGIRPHLFCLPILKRRKHQEELIRIATSGNRRFFLGSDSAPHKVGDKESSCGCAGVYTGHATLELYAEVFDQSDALDKLEGFASFNGPDFYGLPRNTDKVTLIRKMWDVPAELEYMDSSIKPLKSGEQINWIVEHS